MKIVHVVAPLLVALTIVVPAKSPGQIGPPAPSDSLPAVRPRIATLSVEQAVEEAEQSNPEIRAAVRRLSLAQMKIATSRSLDDPMFMVRDWDTPLRKPWDLNQAQAMFSVQQTFPGDGKRELRARVAGDDAEAAADDLETMRQDVSAQVREVCSILLRNADEMQLHNQQAGLLKEASAAVLSEYTTGKAPQGDVLRAQMALTRLNEHLVELNEERNDATAQLDFLMGRDPDSAVEISGSYKESDGLPSLEDLERIAIEHRPELAELRAQVTKSRDMGHLTRLAIKPDFTVAAGYMLMPTGSAFRNAYMAELSMNLPWMNRARHDGEAQQAGAATDVAQAELAARVAAVYLEIRQAQIEVQSAQTRVKLYRNTLLPQAEASFRASTAAYQNSRSDFMNVIDSENLLLDVRTDLYKAASAMDAGIARLERSIGAPLSSTAHVNAITDAITERTGK